MPDYTTVSRRQGGLALKLGPVPACEPRHVVIDATGLKVFGAGEWTIRKHGMGRGRRRTWRKLHLGVDEKTKDIVAVDLEVPSAEPHGLAWDAAVGAHSAGLIRPECRDGGSGWAEPGFCNNAAMVPLAKNAS